MPAYPPPMMATFLSGALMEGLMAQLRGA